MIRQFGKYYVGLVALGICVAHASQVGQLFSAGASGLSTVTGALNK